MNKQSAVAFISHGSPQMAVRQDKLTEQLNYFGKYFESSKALVIMSAHWQSEDLQISYVNKPDSIKDFYGFATELYEVNYPAIGATKLAKDIFDYLQTKLVDTDIQLNPNQSMDHGVWTPLMHLLPKANVPIVQISIPIYANNQWLYQLGKLLKPFREQGISFIGSGSLTHNLTEARISDSPKSYALEFEQDVINAIKQDNFSQIIKLDQHPLYLKSHPTDEHFLPLIFAYGLTDENDQLSVMQPKMEYGVISMTNFFWIKN